MNIQKQQGFVLVLTLGILAIVAIVAAYFAERVARSVELAQQSGQNTRAMIDMAGTRAEILYRLGTTSMSRYGLGRDETAIKLDGQTYRGFGDTFMRLQDNRGLLNLNFTDDDRLQRLLGLLGIPAEKRGHMIDTLRDFTDADKLHRLNGAEEEEYLAQKLPPPPNNILVTPWEAQRIIGWRKVPELWQTGRLADLTAAGISVGLNPNTAPAEILATLPGVTEEIAKAVIARRKLSPIIHDVQLAEIVPVPAQHLAEIIITFPDDSIRITQFTQKHLWAAQYNVTLTPNSDEAPWRIDYYSRISMGEKNEKQTDIPELPQRSMAPPEKAPD